MHIAAWAAWRRRRCWPLPRRAAETTSHYFGLRCLQFQPECSMPVLPRALEIQGEIAAIRRDIHAYPELAYEENGTSDFVDAKLGESGFEVVRGLDQTGFVCTLR